MEKKTLLDVSVVVISWNTKSLLRDCLNSVYQHTRESTFEVIVVDNASVDGSTNMINDQFPRVRLLQNQSNEGFARGCNQGMEKANGRYFLLLNSDAKVVDDAISAIVKFMDDHPDAGAGGCALLYPDGYLQGACGTFPGILAPILHQFDFRAKKLRTQDRRKYFPYPFLTYEQHSSPQDVDWVAGCFMIVRSEVVKQVGLMDDTIFLYAEEWDWCHRIKTQGWRIRYTPQPQVIHLGKASWTLSDGRYATALLDGRDYFTRKHFGRSNALLQRLLRLAGSSVKSVFWLSMCAIHKSQRPFYRERLSWQLQTLRWCCGFNRPAPVTAENIQPRETP